MTKDEIIARVDERYCLDFLAAHGAAEELQPDGG